MSLPVAPSEDLALALALAKREKAILQRQIELRRENGIQFYRPHAKQESFHFAAWNHYRYARTGNRFGKSEMGAAEDVAYALGYRPWVPEGLTLRGLGRTADAPEWAWDVPLRTMGIPQHATKGLIVCTDWDKSTEIFTSEESGANQGKLWKYIPKAALPANYYARNHSGAIDTIRVKHVSGDISVIHLDTVKSFKQNGLSQESSSWDWAHFDEPVPQAMYNAIIRGFIDRDGCAWFTCTPLTEPWIDEKFIPDLESQNHEEHSFQHGDFWMMTGSTWDNPHNKRESIIRVMAQYTDEERETRLSGTPKAYAGLVFKEFDWNLHVRRPAPPGWSDWLTPPATACIRFGIDYHFKKNDAILFCATMPSGVTYVYHEIWEQLLVEDEVLRIKSVLGTHVPQPGIVDPLASTPNKINDLTAMDEYRRLGLAVLPATKDPVNGIRSVKALLKSRDKNGNPLVYINPACRRFLFEISRGFVWDENDNKPVKKNDDMMENFHRLTLQGFDYVEPAGENDYTVIPRNEDFTNVVDATEFLHDRAASADRLFDPAKRYRA